MKVGVRKSPAARLRRRLINKPSESMAKSIPCCYMIMMMQKIAFPAEFDIPEDLSDMILQGGESGSVRGNSASLGVGAMYLHH